MPSNRPVTPSTLSVKDLPWQILYDKDKCTLCGSCCAVCPVHAIELGVYRKRRIHASIGIDKDSYNDFSVFYGIRQKTDPAYACIGCGMCNMVCPNDCILPLKSDESDKLKYHIDRDRKSVV